MLSPTGPKARARLRVFAIFSGILFLSIIAMVSYHYFSKENEYTLVHPIVGPITEAIYGLGTVHATRTFILKAGVAATISDILIEEGQTVKRGQRLLRTNESWIKAPWDALVTSLPVNVGENVMPGIPIIVLCDPTRNYLTVTLEQQDALRIRPGQISRISFENLRDQKIKGVVKVIYSKDEQQFNVRIDLENLPEQILPGMTADVSIEVGKRDNATLIPTSAIFHGKIFLKQGLRFQKIPVQIGIKDGRFAEILTPVLSDKAQIRVPKTSVPEM